MNFLKKICLAFLAVALFGCASSKISQEDRQTLRRISIATIEIPEKPFVPPAGTGAAFVLAGPLGVALANGSTDLPTAFKALLAQHKIDVPTYLKNELRSQLKLKGIEVVDNENQADVVLRVKVMQYGLTGEVFSDNRFPQLWVLLTMTKRNGSTIWKDYAAAHVTEGIAKQLEARPISDYFSDPALLERGYKKVTTLVVTAAMSGL